jgi:hypothetical protein
MESVTKLMLETTEVYFTISESTPLFNSPRVVWVHVLSCKVCQWWHVWHFKIHILTHINILNQLFTGKMTRRGKELHFRIWCCILLLWTTIFLIVQSWSRLHIYFLLFSFPRKSRHICASSEIKCVCAPSLSFLVALNVFGLLPLCPPPYPLPSPPLRR